jgi:hypothetical protein
MASWYKADIQVQRVTSASHRSEGTLAFPFGRRLLSFQRMIASEYVFDGTVTFHQERHAAALVVLETSGRPQITRPPVMEVSMTMHSHHHATDMEDAAFDSTMKVTGIVLVLVAIACLAFWYFAG